MSVTSIVGLIAFYSNLIGIDPQLAIAVAQVESNMNPQAIGLSHGEIGLFQIRPEFVAGLTHKEMFNIETNIVLGIQKLKHAKTKCKHQVNNSWLVCYNVGVKGGNRIKNAKEFKYVKRVNNKMKRTLASK